MSAKTIVCPFYQCFIETPLATSGFITRHKQNGVPLRVEGKSDAPHAICRIEPKLLHVGMARPFERIHTRTTEAWSERFKQLGMRKQFILYFGRKFIEFTIERRIEVNGPTHVLYYDLRCI